MLYFKWILFLTGVVLVIAGMAQFSTGLALIGSGLALGFGAYNGIVTESEA
jgi:hypothetical protein